MSRTSIYGITTTSVFTRSASATFCSVRAGISTSWNTRATLTLNSLADLCFGHHAFANNRPLRSSEGHDCGGKIASRVAAIENQRQPVAKLLGELRRVGAGGEAGEIRARSCDGTSCGFDQRRGNGGIGPAECDAATIARDFQRKPVSRFDDDGQRA